MSTDPTQPAQTPSQRSKERGDAPPPTVATPVQPPAPGGARWGQEGATQAVPQWQPPPPPPPPPGARPTVREPSPPGQWQQDQPTQQWPPQADQQWQAPGPGPGPQAQGDRQQWQAPGQQAPAQGGPQWPSQPPQGPAQPPQGGRRPRRRRMRRSVMALFTVIVILIVLVIADRVACAVTENEFASQFKTQGFPVKPAVNIEGFPFLTQLAAKDFKKVDISASNIPAGPVTISTLHATITGLHISGFSTSASARVDHLTATAFISFGALAAAGGLGGTGVTLTQDGANKVKITAGIAGIASDTEVAQITQTGPQTISIKLLDSGGGLGSLLGSFGSFSFSLPKGVPASLRITGLNLNSQGLTVSAAASNASFSQ